MKRGEPTIAQQMKKRGKAEQEDKPLYDGNTETMISTGSTLLDLAISGGRIRGGGIPGGIFIEIMGQKKTGKTVLLCEIAGDVQRKNGQVQFGDPEGRLNKQFAQIFGLDPDTINYKRPDTVTEVFQEIRKWEPENPDVINGIFADSLAALSTDLEMDKEDGDKMGMRRAKEFSEELRKTCRLLANNNWLMVGSNQLRQTQNTGYGEKYKSPGGEALGYYASLRLKTSLAEKLKDKKTIRGREYEQIKGIRTEIQVYDSSVWKPYRKTDIYILFDYGIDDIRANLQFLKRGHKTSKYTLDGERLLSTSMEESIKIVEEDKLESALKEATIILWEEIESKFKVERKPKERT